MRYFLIAGERSGDLHGSLLITSLLKSDPAAEIFYWGGDYMQKAGGTLLRHYKDTAVMGFWEVLKNLRKLRNLQILCKNEIIRINPDAVIFIDFPGFNLRIAEFTKANGFINFYYISPKVWAWNQKRALKLKKTIDRLFCILPFEKEFFARYGMEVSYVGNPLKQAISDYSFDQGFMDRYTGKRIVGVLPGSRQQEVNNLTSLLHGIVVKFPDHHFLVAGVDNLQLAVYEELKLLGSRVEVVFDRTYEILKLSEVAIVTSGTATLEAALLNTPQVVVYRTSGFSYQIAKRLIKVPFISLVNLIANREVVRELIQSDMSVDGISSELNKVLFDSGYKNRILADYDEISRLIGNQNSPEVAATEIVKFLAR